MSNGGAGKKVGPDRPRRTADRMERAFARRRGSLAPLKARLAATSRADNDREELRASVVRLEYLILMQDQFLARITRRIEDGAVVKAPFGSL